MGSKELRVSVMVVGKGEVGTLGGLKGQIRKDLMNHLKGV